MTKEQILKLDNLSVAEERPGMFVHIHAKEGFVITNWNDGDDITNYTSGACMWLPIMDNYAGNYRTITIAEDAEMIEKQRIAIEKAVMKNE